MKSLVFNFMSLQPVITVLGTAVPVLGADMDTDRIIPARFLKAITFDELAGTMFWDERFTPSGESKQHPIDDPRYAGASLIIGGPNFGCGSSREHAPQAIKRSGIKAIVAESFAEIFFGNSTGIGLPCVTATTEDIAKIVSILQEDPTTEFALDLVNMTLQWESGFISGSIFVQMPDASREALTQGRWDAIAELLVAADAVEKLAKTLPYPKA